MPTDLLTRWGRALDPDHVLPEHPRPQLVRDSYLNLNGRWDYAITSADASSAPERWDGEILVPFSPGGPAVGGGPSAAARRAALVPPVLSAARGLPVPLDGPRPAALRCGRPDLHGLGERRRGGPQPRWLPPLHVRRHRRARPPGTTPWSSACATSPTAAGRAAASSGSQRGKIWYTAQSGIWQTVWAEAVPATYVERLTLTAVARAGGGRGHRARRGRARRRRRRARVTVSADGAPRSDDEGRGRGAHRPAARRGASVVARGPVPLRRRGEPRQGRRSAATSGSGASGPAPTSTASRGSCSTASPTCTSASWTRATGPTGS